MTRIQYFTATSIDGYIADADNSLDWLFEADSGTGRGEDRFTPFFAGVGAMVMGATTYEWVLEHERIVEQPEKWRDMYGDTPVWVFTHRSLPTIPGAAIRFASGAVATVYEEVVASADGRNVWVVGGGDLAGQFADLGRLDEVVLGVAPVTLGAGAPVLPRRLTARTLRLADVERSGSFAYLTYHLIREPSVPA